MYTNMNHVKRRPFINRTSDSIILMNIKYLSQENNDQNIFKNVHCVQWVVK